MSPAYAGVVLDLDGTVYRGDRPCPGARETVEALREAVALRVLSNNATKTRGEYAAKLRAMGIDVDEASILTSAAITARFLASEHPEDSLFVVGEAGLRTELRGAGLTITEDPAEAGVLVVSLDREFDYGTLTDALRALDPETVFVATNPDRTWPVDGGEIPDAAGMIGAVEGVTGREVDHLLGKPSATAAETVLDGLGADPGEVLLVGDRLETDVRMGAEAGTDTALVLTGASSRADLDASSVTPDYVLETVGEVPALVDGV